MYIERELEQYLEVILRQPGPEGIILAGIVGCGKTTLAQRVLEKLGDLYTVFRFTGDDTRFRTTVAANSRFIADHVRSQTQKRALVFVDEVQKTEEVFDALKIAFDEEKISFIVSGSNPHYLSTIAKKRMQRRAQFITLLPLSLAEILGFLQEIPLGPAINAFRDILFQGKSCHVPNLGVSLSAVVKKACERYLHVGGLPLAHGAADNVDALREVQKTVERGFEVMTIDNQNVSDVIRIELARLEAQEFTYKNIFKKTGLNKRDQVNHVIQELMGHGYVVAKSPYFPDETRRSYLVAYSYIDPGIVSYLRGDTLAPGEPGHSLEGYVHARLLQHASSLPVRHELGYFKPYTVDVNDKTKYLPGEIDFILAVGKRLVPLEVKRHDEISAIETPILDTFIKKHSLPFGVVIYGGVPYADVKRKKIYWPYWMI